MAEVLGRTGLDEMELRFMAVAFHERVKDDLETVKHRWSLEQFLHVERYLEALGEIQELLHPLPPE